MTGIECLHEELMKRGYKKQQIINLKIIPEMLDIVINSNGMYQDLDTLQKDVNRLQREKKTLEDDLAVLRLSISDFEKRIEARYKPMEEYIEKFFNAIGSCETAEARDALKIAQMFVNTVDVDTKYDNTAFIIGLSAILSSGALAPVDELRKINKKIPSFKLVKDYNGHYSLKEADYRFIE